MSVETSRVVPVLKNIATRLRIESITATTEAGSGHPTTCLSAADLVAALFFAEMRYDPANPQHEHADRFVLSKGHAAPLLASTDLGYRAIRELTNPDLDLDDSRVLLRETLGLHAETTIGADLRERLTLHNFGRELAELALTLCYDAHFDDIFTVRGAPATPAPLWSQAR